MQIFLKEVAKQVFEDHIDDLSNHHLIFPNRRSALFFRKYFSGMVDRPVLMPQLSTINDLFSSTTKLEVADPLYLIFTLYKSYSKIRENVESFDEFYFWGEMLVNDFDDIDKYLVDSSVIFQNLKDLRDIDSKFGGLDPGVIEIIKQFWKNFDPANITDEKNDFLAVWDFLDTLYKNYRTTLQESGLAYDGMLMRHLIESLNDLSDNSDMLGDQMFHFVGFNALNKCEKELMSFLKNREKALFYWDYDHLYIQDRDHEAGFFIRENLESYGQDLKGKVRYDNLIDPDQPEDKWTILKAPSDVAQCKLIPGLLSGFDNLDPDPNNIAIVLANESMLLPVMNSIPESISDVNITMGYPLNQTPVFSLVDALLSLQKNRTITSGITTFYYIDIIKVLKHQYIFLTDSKLDKDIIAKIRDQNLIRIDAKILRNSKFFELLFSDVETQLGLNQYLINILQEILAGFTELHEAENSSGDFKLQQEYLYIAIKSLKQIETILNSSDILVGEDIYRKVVDRMLRKLAVPFSGEPLKGLQVMGVLETRALDFENIIFISVNEGILPKSSAGNSYIPYNLRRAFGLPTIKHQDSIYAYYFYRLVQRAKRVRFIYNSSASGIKTGEMSRFLLQLKYNKNLDTRFIDSRFNILPQPVPGDFITRDNTIQEILINSYLSGENQRALSPSALNTWIGCRMRFYYRYVIGLKEPKNVQEEVDAPLFGTILHDVMNRLYSAYIGKEMGRDEIEAIRENKELIETLVTESFRRNFMNSGSGDISGKNRIIISVLKNMVSQILLVDRNSAPIKLLELEKEYFTTVSINSDGIEYAIKIGGTIDRVDSLGQTIRILDYKSGKDSLDIDSLDSLTAYNIKNRNSAAFQTFLYSHLFSSKNKASKLRPSLYPVRSIYNEDFSDLFIIKRGDQKGIVEDFHLLENIFVGNLKVVLADILNPNREFDMTTNKESCKYCPFSNLCGRQDVK